MFKNYLKEYFSFSRSEKYGVFFLIGIIIVLFIIQLLLPLNKNQSTTDYSSFTKKIEDFKNSLILTPKSKSNNNAVDEAIARKLFSFDPNTTNREEWQMLGLNNKQINTINKYLSKGGKFYKKDDLKKIYGIEDKLYNQLEPFIRIKKISNNEQEEKKRKYYPPSFNQIQQIKINSANAESLMKIRGIGEVLSKRIIKYRKSLGGFISNAQLKEVYGINDSVYHNLLEVVQIDTSNITKINLNTCELKKLQGHPYINAYQAGAIINYRKFKNGFSSVDELIQNKLLPGEIFQKVEGYLCVRDFL